MNVRWLSILTLAGLLVGAGSALAKAEKKQTKDKEVASFGTLRTDTLESARGQSLDWLKGTGKLDEKAFAAIWEQPDRCILDKVADTFALGDADAHQLLTEARDPIASAPLAVPDILKDAKRPIFYRANLGLAYAKALSNRRVYEEALETLRTIKPEQVVDPASYFFHRAVTEYSMLQKREATGSIDRLLDDVTDAPERLYDGSEPHVPRHVVLRDKDLAEIARKMDNIERRLDLARGGAHTQKLEKDVIARLDELIKKLENQQKESCSGGDPGGDPQDGQCPPSLPQAGPAGGSNQPSNPMKDSQIATNSGPGKADGKIKELTAHFIKLPEKERAKAMQDLTKDLPPKHREIIENYFKKLSSASSEPIDEP